jgi:hypothetical protein
MENIIDLLKKLFKDILEYVDSSPDLLLYIGLGTLLLLLMILILARKRRPREKNDVSSFIEVGLEPVIVYNSDKETEKSLHQTKDIPAKDKKTAESSKKSVLDYGIDKPKHESNPDNELKPEITPPSGPELGFTPVPDPESKTEFVFSPETRSEPSNEHRAGAQPEPSFEFAPEPEPVSPRKPEPLDLSPTPQTSPFQQFMDSEPGLEAATTFKPALSQDPLPLLESDIASEVLLMFSKQGYHIEKVVYHGTFGADFIVSSKGMRAYVQIKDWKKKATPRTVQEARYYSNTNHCHKTILIPVTGFTSAANKEAAQRAVLLWDMKIIKKIKNGQLSIEEMIAASSF